MHNSAGNMDIKTTQLNAREDSLQKLKQMNKYHMNYTESKGGKIT